jgi:hypothetical protein
LGSLVIDHYTPEQVAQDCLNLIPFSPDDVVIDAGSGTKKVWFDNVKTTHKYEYELSEGHDFLTCNQGADWIVGNPPFDIFWLFLEHSMKLSRKGIGFLMSTNCINSMFLPRRLKLVEDAGFGIVSIHVLNIKKWRGRYFFVIYKKGAKHIMSYNTEVYS